MDAKISLRNQRVTDAKRFFQILNNPNFKFLRVCPDTVEEEKNFLRKNQEKRKNGFEYNYSIIFKEKVVGGCGLKINQHRKFIGEIGYFVDEEYWGFGIATEAVKILEQKGFNEFKLKRIEILMNPENSASEKVAINAGYKKEGRLKKTLEDSGSLMDANLYAKTKD
ncbi:MAG: GNAT family N-acetyltransferase [Nanobdellota archaeon]